MAQQSIFSFIDGPQNGLWTARYGNFTLKTALQPIFRQKLDGELSAFGSEGLLRPYIDELAMAPAQFFATADLPLVDRVDCLSRIVHVLNFANSMRDEQQCLFISFHPALLQSRSHILRELERLASCTDEVDLPHQQVICQMSVHNLPQSDRLHYFADALRSENFKLAITHIDAGTYAMPSVFSLKPDYIKLTGEWIKLGVSSRAAAHLLRKIIERCAVLEIEPILTGIENKEQLSFCRQLHPINLQGHYLSKPMLADPSRRVSRFSSAISAPLRKIFRARGESQKLFSSAYVPALGVHKSKAPLFGKRRAAP